MIADYGYEDGTVVNELELPTKCTKNFSQGAKIKRECNSESFKFPHKNFPPL